MYKIKKCYTSIKGHFHIFNVLSEAWDSIEALGLQTWNKKFLVNFASVTNKYSEFKTIKQEQQI